MTKRTMPRGSPAIDEDPSQHEHVAVEEPKGGRFLPRSTHSRGLNSTLPSLSKSTGEEAGRCSMAPVRVIVSVV